VSLSLTANCQSATRAGDRASHRLARRDNDAAARLQLGRRRQTLDCTARSQLRGLSIDTNSSSIKFALYDLPLEIDLINAVGVSQFVVG